jgi:hypothetical protein
MNAREEEEGIIREIHASWACGAKVGGHEAGGRLMKGMYGMRLTI